MSRTPPRKAVVLAAGFGSRLDPLTRILPKPLLPFHGQTLLDRTLDQLYSWGVREVLINLHTHADQIFNACRERPESDLQMTFSFEPELLGTGGVLRRAAWFIGEEPFWMVNADVVADLQPAPLIKALNSSEALASLWMVPDRGPRTVQVQDGCIQDFRSPVAGGQDTMTFSGVQLIRPGILDYLPASETFSSIVDAYEAGIKDGCTVLGIAVESSWWADVGTPEQFLDAHGEWAERNELEPVEIAPTASVSDGARLSACVVMKEAVVGRAAKIHRAIIGPGTRVNREVSRLVVSAFQGLTPPEKDAAVRQGFTESAALECMSPRGSARSFYRILEGGRAVLLIRTDPSRTENRFYMQQARLLRSAGLPVFEVLEECQNPNFALVQSLGRITLLDRIRGLSPAGRKAWYRQAMTLMNRFHHQARALARRKRIPLMEPFTVGMFRQEHALFQTHLLEDHPLGASDLKALEQNLQQLARRLARLPRTVVHRDYQSTNLMSFQRKLWVIDFQGMRRGPAVYDLASLLLDPYVNFKPAEIEDLLDLYPSLPTTGSLRKETFWMAGVQRLLQASGAYARLSRLPGCAQYRTFIPVARERIRLCLDHLEGMEGIRAWAEALPEPADAAE